MAQLAALLVLLLPLAGGVCLSRYVFRYRMPGAGPATWGYGLLLGLLGATLLLRLLDVAGLELRPPAFIAAGFLLLLPCGALAMKFSGRYSSAPPPADQRLSAPQMLAFACLAALTLLHIALASTEAFTRPVFGWDVTMHWATKARVWYDQARLVPFVSNKEWLARGVGAGVFTDHHPGYPPTIPLLQLWIAIAGGHWDEVAVNAAWPLFAIALALIFYGQGRQLGASPLTSICFTYLLMSLPLVNAHVALAGYADLPLGVVYLAALGALLKGLKDRDLRVLALALFLAVMMTQLKHEGFFWALTLLPLVAVYTMPRRLVFGLLLAAGLAVIPVVLFFPRDLTVAGHSLETLQIAYDGRAAPALLFQFVLNIWHLLALVVAGAGVLYLVRARQDLALTALASALAAAVFLYLFLFTSTRFSYGAVNLTASPRVGLHLVPALLFFAMLVWQRTAARFREPAPVPSGESAPVHSREASGSGK